MATLPTHLSIEITIVSAGRIVFSKVLTIH
jgi:hypothetical protein